MEEEMLSVISNSVTNVIAELSDSTSCSHIPASKHARHMSIGVPHTKFKGVVPQQNGHWGAQIYANHQRIWLGTFKTEKEAAMAYDSASIRLRSTDSHRNFPWTDITVEEPKFQSHFSKEAVLNMIRDGSYESKFVDFLRNHSKYVPRDVSLSPMKAYGNGWLMCRQLFQKELTPSDVGKLNRLVIPKKYAVKYFPHIFESGEEHIDTNVADDVQLVFHDRLMRLWKFRYCYWKSSQSFVFTRGWNRFVKENQVKTKDTVAFYLCECIEKAQVTKTFFMIDVNKVERCDTSQQISDERVDIHVDSQLQSSSNIVDDDENEVEEEDDAAQPSLTHSSKQKGIKLFGVQIF
ncbi:hypothetical protein Patl1_14784 [Pistacia atlantica]|uniref:Uncharacterized protein n=1 Tax=Pistacia atlantica TaxID=434234 RepID=A0ACC1ATW5_9ROSI|nr:hypothetical protein Patl1_14784 [Pistacia atlantica]